MNIRYRVPTSDEILVSLQNVMERLLEVPFIRHQNEYVRNMFINCKGVIQCQKVKQREELFQQYGNCYRKGLRYE